MSITGLTFPSKPQTNNVQPQQLPSGNSFPSIEVTGNANIHMGNQYFTGKNQNQDAIDNLIRSLHFPDILHRYESISEPHTGTFEWILRPDHNTILNERGGYVLSNDSYPKWDSFPEWLDGPESIYWISGKAGSGKSALMKFLVNNLGNFNNNDGKPCLNLTFWFWEAGSELERNLDGCLRSLLWQSLQNPLSESAVTHILSPYLTNYTWTRSRLTNTFKICLAEWKKAEISPRIFLDGLDESGFDADEIIDFITDLTQQNPNLKLCISSRPEQAFVDSFSHRPQLRLQDLNRGDIMKVIQEKFLKNPKVVRLLNGKADLADRFEKALVKRAQGVFLWAVLAIRNLTRGLTNRDSIDILETRLNGLPDDLNSLYTSMFGRSEKDMNCYRKAAAFYFQLKLQEIKMFTVLDFCFAINEELRRGMLEKPFTLWDDPNLETHINAEEVMTWIITRTGGLLEIYEQPFPRHAFAATAAHSSAPAHRLQCLKRFPNSRIDFIHRTVRTFLLDTTTGHDILSHCIVSPEQMTNICDEIDMIRGFILPGLAGSYPGIFGYLPRRDPFGLRSRLSTTRFDMVFSVWSELLRRGLLRCAKVLPGTALLSTDLTPFPAGFDGLIDICQVCCTYGWYSHCRQLLDSLPSYRSIENLSLLLVFVLAGVVYSLYPMKSKREEMIHYLLDHGATLQCEIESPYDGKVSLLSLVYFMNRCGTTDDQNHMDLVCSPHISRNPYRIARNLPSIESCDFESHLIHQLYKFKQHWVLWVNFGVLDYSVANRSDLFPNETELPRVFMLARYQSNSVAPDLYEVTRKESDRIIFLFERGRTEMSDVSPGMNLQSLNKFDPTFSWNIQTEGILHLHDLVRKNGRSGSKTWQNLREVLEQKRKSSEPFKTLLDALLFIGKSRESVLKYVADKEADLLRFRSKAEVASWKTWVLGPSSSNDNSVHEDEGSFSEDSHMALAFPISSQVIDETISSVPNSCTRRIARLRKKYNLRKRRKQYQTRKSKAGFPEVRNDAS